jgi:3'-phosphoadenosine 5'-phosphosulfate (PAPS) 3'-phosphatase
VLKLTFRILVCRNPHVEEELMSVDGTSGFIRHQQFAVCLALIVDGQVELGVIGCPNLGPEAAKIGEEVIPNGKGVLMVAVKGQGSFSVRPSHCILK